VPGRCLRLRIIRDPPRRNRCDVIRGNLAAWLRADPRSLRRANTRENPAMGTQNGDSAATFARRLINSSKAPATATDQNDGRSIRTIDGCSMKKNGGKVAVTVFLRALACDSGNAALSSDNETAQVPRYGSAVH